MNLKKIIFIVGLFIAIATTSKAAYVYNDEANLLILSRNTTKPTYTITYDKDSWTNEDVSITIISDKVVQIIGDGYTVGEDGKTINFVMTDNGSGTIRVRDENYNYQDINYEVSWIDKEKPSIIGAEDGATYNTGVELSYTDNVEIANIFVDRYDDTFTLFNSNSFFDNVTYQFVPLTRTTITAWVQKHIRGTVKYNYYLDNVLYATTSDTRYTYTGLEELTSHVAKVEALDKYGNVISTSTMSEMITPVFDNVTINRTETSCTATFTGISDNVFNVVCYRWLNANKEGTQIYGDIKMENNQASCTLTFSDHGSQYGLYKMHVYFYYLDSEGKQQVCIYGGNIYYQESYDEAVEITSIYEVTADGKYYVCAEDIAGNETEIDFTIAK